jgi:hypothetical protein
MKETYKIRNRDLLDPYYEMDLFQRPEREVTTF